VPKADPFDSRGYGVGDGAPGAGTLAPISTNPVARSADVKGGCMQVLDLTARDAIPGEGLARDDPGQHRQEGMLCFVQADQTTYRLQGGIANVNWTPFGVSAGGGPTVPAADNQTGVAIAKGTVVGAATGGPNRVQPFDAADASLAAARIVGLVTEVGGIGIAAQGEVSITAYDTVLFKNALAPAPVDGDEFYASGDTPGRVTTLADLNANPPPVGGVRHRLGVVMDASTYAGTDLCSCVFYPGQRRDQI